MNGISLLFAIACLLAGCDRPQALLVDTLAADAARSHALHGQRDASFCAQIEQASLRRFISGRVGPGEYQTLVDLTPIPASVDGPKPTAGEPTEQRS
ncbi:hypothetical protein [Chitinasiproducens palmae]|uniref:Uncharacterized protein n=1 Tax=Chitinasiproducens palmae TaxID=1770053 RepID=A0A1H2PUI0_9BURK|nr:hypothetical protein [Chitinasiproducens palmae]SDV50829.1 hypothetical protein SAMN05216551_113145 [Chitinasiproducens palmae]